MQSQELLQFILGLVLILLGAKLAGAFMARLGQPPVLGELLVGLALGPSLFGLVPDTPIVQSFAQVGVVFLMFMAGLETNMREMRLAGRSSFLSALGGVILPMAGGTAAGLLFGQSLTTSLFLGAILTATSVSISAETLRQLGVLKSREGSTILGAAVIDDVMGVIMLALVMAVSVGANPVLPVAQMALFFIVTAALGYWLLPRLDDWMLRHGSRELALAIILAVVLVAAWSAQALGGVASITGAYMAGLLLGRTKAVHDHHSTISSFTHGFFAPIFFVSIGLQVQIGSLQANLLFALAVILIAIVAKFAGSGLGAWVGGLRPVQSLRVGVGMISRGEVALIIAGVGLQSGIIGSGIFATAILVTLVTTLVTPVLLKFAFSAQLSLPAFGIANPQPVLAPAEEELLS